jgi:hypothetical protein
MVGKERPAKSISWDDGYFVVIYSELDPDDPDATPSMPVCLDCLVEDGDVQLARGLDLARINGQVDFDVAAGEWFVPEDAGA